MGLYVGTKAFQNPTEAIRSELPRGSRVVVSTLNPPFTRTRLIEDAGVPLDFIPVKISFMTVDEVTGQGAVRFLEREVRPS